MVEIEGRIDSKWIHSADPPQLIKERQIDGKSFARVAGWGMYVPSRVVSNDQLVQLGVDTSDEWIRERTGIKQRHLVSQGEATSDLAVKAGQRALDVANVRSRDIDLIIVATCTPDHLLPSTASIVQDRLGAVHAGALDVNAACSGFVYSIALATGQIESGRASNVLVIGADVLSAYIDWPERSTSVLFGDGAGALLLQSSDEPGVLSATLGSDGSGAGLLIIPGGGTRLPPNGHTLGNGDHHLKMNGRQIFRGATQMMERAAGAALRSSGLKPEDIELLIPHQANQRIIEAVGRKLDLNPEQVFMNVDKYGNTVAASIPIALCEAIEQGRVKPEDHIMLVSFGAGLSWAATVIRWGTPLPVHRPFYVRFKQRLGRRFSAIRSIWRRWRRRLRGIVERFSSNGSAL